MQTYIHIHINNDIIRAPVLITHEYQIYSQKIVKLF